MSEAVTPETAAVDAPVSMDSIIEEIASGNPQEGAEAVSEVVEELEAGQADEAAEAEEDATEAVETDEETAEEEAEETDEQPEPTYKVKVDGEEVEVPLSELTKGYSREQDYTKKTMALAEERRSLQSKFAEELKQATDLFESMDPVLSAAKDIDWQALAASDPATYVQLQEAVKQRQAAVTEARAKITDASKGDEGAQTADKAERATKTEEALVKAMPELADPEKMVSFAKSNIDFLTDQGLPYSDIEDFLLDPVAVQIINDARRFRAQEKAKAGLPAKKVVPKPKATSLKSDNPDSSRPAKRLSARAPYEQRMAHVLNELTRG